MENIISHKTLTDYNTPTLRVEVCNSYKYSELNRPNNPRSLYNQFLESKANGIRSIFIWDHELNSRNGQCVNFIKSAANLNTRKINARSCEIKKVCGKTAKMFVNQFHIQPVHSAGISYGAYYDNDLVAIMLFNKHHRNSKEIVLSRFCCNDNTSVVGGASRLLSHAFRDNEWDEIVSWSDNRISEGNLYSKIGFTKKFVIRPDYFYLDKSGRIIPKQSATKKKLDAKEGQTEYERAIELGLNRVWDCGKIKWAYGAK